MKIKFKKIYLGLLICLVVIIGVIIVGKLILKSSLDGAVFLYKGEGKDSKLFYVNGNKDPKYLITLPSEEMELGKYKVPRHSYVSNNGKIMIYFERFEEIPIETISEEEGLVAYRILYKPKYIDLKNGSIKEIQEDMDPSSLVFSPDSKKIAWVLSTKESTIDELEENKVRREVWISSPDGTSAKFLAALDEKVLLLRVWQGNYIYFWGVIGVGYYSLGRIDIERGKVEYIQPKYCSENLANCQNFEFSSSGKLFIYEAASIKNGEKNIELFVESFDGRKSWQILANNYISDRLWLAGGRAIIYTEQKKLPKNVIQETIHLINLETEDDKEVYSGSYISQITSDDSGKYLYFVEKETDEKFNLIRLKIKGGTAEILNSGLYNQLKIFSNN